MFTNKKPIIEYHDGDDFFTQNNHIKIVQFYFKDIYAFYWQSTVQFTNGVYTDDVITIRLFFSDREDPIELKQSTDNKDDYKIILEIANAIKLWRMKKLSEQYQLNKKVTFQTCVAEKKIHLTDNQLFIDQMPVKTLYLNTNGNTPLIECLLDEKKYVFSSSEISDIDCFLEMASDRKLIQPKQPSKLKQPLQYGLYASVTVLGLNGWFDLYNPNEFINGISVFSQIILSVWLITAPMYLLVAWRNSIKMKKNLSR